MNRAMAFRRAAELLALDVADNRYDPDETRMIVGTLLVAFQDAQRDDEKMHVAAMADEPIRAWK